MGVVGVDEVLEIGGQRDITAPLTCNDKEQGDQKENLTVPIHNVRRGQKEGEGEECHRTGRLGAVRNTTRATPKAGTRSPADIVAILLSTPRLRCGPLVTPRVLLKKLRVRVVEA